VHSAGRRELTERQRFFVEIFEKLPSIAGDVFRTWKCRPWSEDHDAAVDLAGQRELEALQSMDWKKICMQCVEAWFMAMHCVVHWNRRRESDLRCLRFS
jgi:hypothetical protein